MIHEEQSPLAGKLVKVKAHVARELGGAEYRVEDWWDRVIGKSWMFCDGNPACLNYAIRTGFAASVVPTDNEVLYGKVGGLGYLVHVTSCNGNRVGACRMTRKPDPKKEKRERCTQVCVDKDSCEHSCGRERGHDGKHVCRLCPWEWKRR